MSEGGPGRQRGRGRWREGKREARRPEAALGAGARLRRGLPALAGGRPAYIPPAAGPACPHRRAAGRRSGFYYLGGGGRRCFLPV